MAKAKNKIKIEGEVAPEVTFEQFKAWQQSQATPTKAASISTSAPKVKNNVTPKRKNTVAKFKNSVPDNILGFALHADGRVDAIKQGSGIYGSGFGTFAFSETAFSSTLALSQSTFGWSAAYSVSTWCYRCIEVRKKAVSRMPWHIYSKRTGKVVSGTPVEVALRRNRQKLFQRIEVSQLLFGETFIELAKIEDPRNPFVGTVSDLYWLNNNGMAVIQGAGYIEGYQYTAMQGGTPLVLDVNDVAFMKTFNPMNDLRGMSPTEVVMDEIAIDKDVARVVRAYYANDTRVGLLLIPKRDMQPADSERFMQTWKLQHQGVNQAGKPILMPQDVSVERVQEPATLDDVQLRESVRREIASGYGVPLALAGAWDEANYDSVDTQRKSFYEETVIPECDDIADFINHDIMPRFDGMENVVFKFDYSTVLALGEDANAKITSITSKLNAGLITLNEAREASGEPALPTGNVFYIPAGVIMVTPDLLGEMQPKPSYQPFGNPQVTPYEASQLASGEVPPPPVEVQQQQAVAQGSSIVDANKPLNPDDPTPPTDNPQPPALPAPNKPEPKQPAAQAPQKTVAPVQSSADAELAAWEKRALNTDAIKATLFVCNHLPDDVQAMVRTDLNAAGRGATKATIRAVFARAKEVVTPPPDVVAYWRDYDQLQNELGYGWLADYMSRAFAALEPTIDGEVSPDMVQAALDANHEDFANAWLGTEDAPGPLVKLIQAGMAAGQSAINTGHTTNPQKPVKAVEVDWNLLATEARDFARQYLYSLIREIDDTTRKAVQDAVTKWLESGQPISELKKVLETVFTDKSRAALIAQTETTRAYAEGSLERYRRADVTKVKWRTVRSTNVCPVCEKLGKEPPAPVDAGFKASSGNSFPPNHPGCRCFLQPVVEVD